MTDDQPPRSLVEAAFLMARHAGRPQPAKLQVPDGMDTDKFLKSLSDEIDYLIQRNVLLAGLLQEVLQSNFACKELGPDWLKRVGEALGATVDG